MSLLSHQADREAEAKLCWLVWDPAVYPVAGCG